jgi:hypothetical protein
MNRMDQLFKKLGYERSNGLFYLEDADKWMGKFPYRIGRVLKDIIRPYAFYSPFHGETSTDREHPEPLNNPIILFFDHPDEEVAQRIPGWTFSFSQAPIVIINKDDYAPLEIYHGYNFDNKEQKWLKKIDKDDVDISDFSVHNLTTGGTWKKLYERYFKNIPKIDKYLLKNIIDARRILIAKDTGGLPPRTANRLIGRLLFVRYLIDRNVAFEDDRFIKGQSKTDRQKSLENLLMNKEQIYCFFRSITESFNGDLFPLVEKDEKGTIVYDEEKNVEQKHLNVMYYLFTCSEFFRETGNWNGYTVQKSLFNFYDFEVIPVELISNIYENFLVESHSEKRLKELSRQKEIKAYYTPPFLVDYVLSETVIPHLANQEEASCKVLDPACGSGIFLVETLRKLIEKEMELNSKPGFDNKPAITHERLWKLVNENIFGIDIDRDAIEITIFSLYITLLDYQKPKEISSFRFKKLKNRNLFGGEGADFFNENHQFNKIFKKDVHLDFIIGNPPWGGDVPASKYKEYIKNRNDREKQDIRDGGHGLEISNDEISQAFMIRTSDFALSHRKTKCVLVVTGKNLYNADAAKWRSYFLNNFCISKVFELSSINNKNRGGPKLFEHAKQTTAVISYHPRQRDEDPGNSLMTHVTARANDYWVCFKTIIIEKQDVKKIVQRYFMENRGGYDWLWKVILHGNILDFNFIRRLKGNNPTLTKVMERLKLTFKGGLKPVDNSVKPGNRKSTGEIKNWKYLEISKSRRYDEFQQFIISPSKSFKEKLTELVRAGKIHADEKVAQLPNIYFFKGKKLLLKNGLSPGFRAFAAVYDEDLVFTHSVCSIKPKPGEPSTADIYKYFHILAALFNSELFTYFIFNTGKSAGIERTRANFVDFFDFPIRLDMKIGAIAEKIKQNCEKLNSGCPGARKKDLKNEIQALKEEIENIILNIYGISEEERALIDYAVKVSIPVFKRQAKPENRSLNIFKALSLDSGEDRDYLREYAAVFIDHFGERFNKKEKYFVVDIHLTSSFIGFHFKITKKPDPHERIFFVKCASIEEMVNRIGELGYHKLSKDLYIRQDIRGFNKTSFYVIKSNQRKAWHKAVAYADLSEFIQDLVKEEIKRKSA